jgi:hypothetical protein
VLGPFEARFGDAVAALPRRDAERVAAIVAFGTTKVTPDVIAALPALALVCCVGSGYEGVDLDAARARGIAVANSVGSNASAVADLAVGLLIASVRGIAAGDAFVRRGDWARRKPPRRRARAHRAKGRRLRSRRDRHEDRAALRGPGDGSRATTDARRTPACAGRSMRRCSTSRAGPTS